MKTRKELPIYQFEREVLEQVDNNDTVIFIGDTAIGKTTQIPQILLENGFGKEKCIAVIQPQQFYAMMVSACVAEETKTNIGEKIGYSFAFEKVFSSATKIKYLTDFELLREVYLDHLLSDYSVIILDEAHERTVNSDILYGLVKFMQSCREELMLPLKVIVLSAPINFEHLSEYFGGAPVYRLSGPNYRIQIKNSIKTIKDYISAAVKTIFKIHQNMDDGGILVFCVDQEEIYSMMSLVHFLSETHDSGSQQIILYDLNETSFKDQMIQISKPLLRNYRKVIFSTDIAETSIEIPGIKYVVDPGMIKTKSYSATCASNIERIQRTSKVQQDQRAVRAGREFNGICYQLYTAEESEIIEEHIDPEILRCNLSNTFLHMIAIGIKDIENFNYIDKPPDQNIYAAIEELKSLDAIEGNNGSFKLTECGKKMVSFPLDPRFSKMIITAEAYGCICEIITIISFLLVEPIFYTGISHVPSQKKKFIQTVRKFEESKDFIESDHIMLLNVYKFYEKSQQSLDWCHENFINSKVMRKADSIRKYLFNICNELGINISSCNITRKIIMCLASGLFMNAAIHHKDKIYKTIEGGLEVEIHSSSCLYRSGSRPYWCMYSDLVQDSKIYMRQITEMDLSYLLEVAPDFY